MAERPVFTNFGTLEDIKQRLIEKKEHDMGGKPNPGTKKDGRLAANKPKSAQKPVQLPKKVNK